MQLFPRLQECVVMDVSLLGSSIKQFMISSKNFQVFLTSKRENKFSWAFFISRSESQAQFAEVR